MSVGIKLFGIPLWKLFKSPSKNVELNFIAQRIVGPLITFTDDLFIVFSSKNYSASLQVYAPKDFMYVRLSFDSNYYPDI